MGRVDRAGEHAQLACALIACFAMGCAPVVSSAPVLAAAMGTLQQQSALPPWLNWTLPTATRAKALVAAMQPEEKTPQLVVDAPAIERLQVPAYHWRSNVLHGLVSNGVSTVFPQAIGMAAAFDAPLLQRSARVWADEQRAKHNVAVNASGGASPMDYGVNLWGPNINSFVHPLWGRGQETYGESPTLSGLLVRAAVRGLQFTEDGIMETGATAKHFDAYSVDKEPPRLSYLPNISATDLRQHYFPAFTAAVDAGVSSIMCSYNGVATTLGNASFATPMCMSPMLQSVLRDEMGFEGYIVTDSGALEFMVSKFHRFNNTEDVAVAAISAGVDLNSGEIFDKPLASAVTGGRVSQDQLDAALLRLFTARIDSGTLDPPSRVPFSGLGPSVPNSEPNRQVALQMARESLVLLKNEANLLPLALGEGGVRNVAVVGPAANDTYRMAGNYQGCTHGAWQPLMPGCNITTPLAGVHSVFGGVDGVSVDFVEGCAQESNDTSGFAAATSLAVDSDVVIAFMGLRNCEGGQGMGGAHCESEGHDRPDLQLPGVQTEFVQALVATGTPVVLVLSGGGPVATVWEAQHVPAILETWYSGALGGIAVAEALAGKFSPSGRLPVTFYTGMAQLPADPEGMRLAGSPGRTLRYLDQTPLWAFGFGLSYTNFTYSGVSVSPSTVQSSAGARGISVDVCATVTNVGGTAADEVVEVFASLETPDRFAGQASVPLKQLAGFNRTGVVQAGKAVLACVAVNTTALLTVAPNGAYGLQPGMYNISIGGRAPGAVGSFVEQSALPALLYGSLTVEDS